MDTEFSIGFIVLEASVKSNLDVKRHVSGLSFTVFTASLIWLVVGVCTIVFVCSEESHLTLVILLRT